MRGWTKRLFQLWLVGVTAALLGITQSALLASGLDVSDPASYPTETFSENVGWMATSVYPRERRYTFFSGAEGSVEITLSSPWLRYLGLDLLDASGRTVEGRDLYYRGSPYRTAFYVHPALYTIRIRGDLWGAYADHIPYVLTLRHPQSAPQIELSSPANTAIVSHTVEVSVEKKDIPSNPEIASLDVFLAGSPVASFSAPPYSFPLNTDIYANTYNQLEFRAYDEAGRYNPLTSSIEVRNLTPDTQTESFKGRIGWGSAGALLYPRSKDFSFEMQRTGTLNAVMSGDRRLRFLSWIIKDSNSSKVYYSSGFYYEGSYVRRSIYLSQGSYTLTVFDTGFSPTELFISYILTLDYPAKRKIIDRLTVGPTALDPSEDGEDTTLGSVLINYNTLEPAYLSLEIKDEEGRPIKSLLVNSLVAAGAHLSSWDGLDDEGSIADEGHYAIVLRSFDGSGSPLDSASTSVEVVYHSDM